MPISLTRTTIYDVDKDYDVDVDRIDDVNKEEVLAYVPVNSKYRETVIEEMEKLSAFLEESIADEPDSDIVDLVSGDPPESLETLSQS